MAQNIYDDEGFFANYSQLRRSVEGLDGAAEWPAMRGLLPDIANSAIVDLGCGFGWFARWAMEHSAASVLGIDLSARMLERARRDTADERVEYRQANLDEIDLDEIDLGVARFDLAYSSLLLHYLTDLDRFCATVARCLRPGGAFVFSVEHPTFTAPTRASFIETADGDIVWPLDSYLVEGPRETDWLAPGVIKQHRTIGTYVSALRRAGLAVDELIEWGPSDDELAEHPEWAIERHRPPFLLVRAIAPASSTT